MQTKFRLVFWFMDIFSVYVQVQIVHMSETLSAHFNSTGTVTHFNSTGTVTEVGGVRAILL